MSRILACAITAYVITFLVTPVIIRYFKNKNVLDSPGRRKIHKTVKPSMGGIAIFFGFFASIIIWMPFEGFETFKYVLAAFFIIFLTGLRDDILPMKPVNKLMGQLVAAMIVVILTDIRIHSFYGLFNIEEIPYWAGTILTLFTIVVITNSFNLIDGMDGLAGTIATIALATFGVWFYLINIEILAILCVSMLTAVLAFLKFNWQPSKIFMGDTGALLLGFMFSILAILFINYNGELGVNNTHKFQPGISTAVCILIIPLLDTLRVFVLRVLKGKSPFSPDKNHMHHLLMRMGNSHQQTALILGGIQLAFILFAILMRDYADSYVLPMIIILAAGTSGIIYLFLSKNYRHRLKSQDKGSFH